MIGIAKTLLAGLWLLMVLVSPAWSVEVGESMPDFAFQSLEGKEFSRAALKGKPLLLVFWNTWCPNCMQELPRINQLAETYAPRGLEVLAVNTAINDTERKTRIYWEKSGYVFSCGFDDTFEIGQSFAVRGVPTLFLVDRQGIVRFKQVVLPEDVEQRLEHLLQE